MIITNSTPDEFYFEQLLAFITSLKINSPEHTIRVFLANYPDSLWEKLQTSFDNCIFESWELEQIPGDKRDFALIMFRVAMLRDCLESYGESVAWIDTDVLVRKNLSEFLEVGSKQLKILVRQTNYANQFDAAVNAGIFNLGCSPETYDFVDDWYKGCEANPVWGQGQVAMWSAYKKHSKNVELVPMHLKFNDLGDRNNPNMFADDSVMWHCKANHFDNEKFQSEFQYYLKKGKEILNG
jgi:hypothetical protein